MLKRHVLFIVFYIFVHLDALTVLEPSLSNNSKFCLDMRNDASLSTSQQSGEFQAKLSELCRHVHSAFDGLPNSSYVVV